MTKLLLPIDGSDCSQDTLKWAAQSLEPPHQFCLLYVLAQDNRDLSPEKQEKEAVKSLKKAKDLLEKSGHIVLKADSCSGTPWKVICDYAEKETHLNGVLMGSHGRTRLAKVLLGSVSQKVMENCKKPLILYRKKERISGLE